MIRSIYGKDTKEVLNLLRLNAVDLTPQELANLSNLPLNNLIVEERFYETDDGFKPAFIITGFAIYILGDAVEVTHFYEHPEFECTQLIEKLRGKIDSMRPTVNIYTENYNLMERLTKLGFQYNCGVMSGG